MAPVPHIWQKLKGKQRRGNLCRGTEGRLGVGVGELTGGHQPGDTGGRDSNWAPVRMVRVGGRVGDNS